jgi:hypothetical protein
MNPHGGAMTDLTLDVIGLSDGSYTSDKERLEKFSSIIKRCMLFVYQNCRYLSIRSEEASGFVLYIMPSLSRIVRKFVYIGADFEQYLYKIMKFRRRSYFSDMMKKKKQMEVGDLLYSIATDECYGSDDSVLSEDNPIDRMQPLLRIAMVCHQLPAWRRRMVTYLLSMLPLLDFDKRTLICNLFQMSERELADYQCRFYDQIIARKNSRDDLIEKLNRSYFRKIEVEILVGRENGAFVDQSLNVNEKFLRKISRRNKMKLDMLQSRRTAISEELLCSVFPLSRGTISSNVHYARVLAQCAVDPSSDKMKLLPLKAQLIVNRNYDPDIVRSQLSAFSIDKLIFEMETESQMGNHA